jgi:hypothetical protein
MSQYTNPKWWTPENDSAWDRTKAALKRDWDQTKHDIGGNEPETNQKVSNTVKQAAGTEAIPPRRQPTYEDVEPALRFGHGAHSYYGKKYPTWNDEMEGQLKEDWMAANPSRQINWREDRVAIRHAWNYRG